MGNIKLENNQSVCIQRQNMITGTNFVNVCNGEKTFVPYGSADWLLVVMLIAVIVGFGVGFYKLFIELIT